MLSKFFSLFKKSNKDDVEDGTIFVPKIQGRRHVMYIKSEKGYIMISRKSNDMLEKNWVETLPLNAVKTDYRQLSTWDKNTYRIFSSILPKFEESYSYKNRITDEVIKIEIVRDCRITATKEDGEIINISPLTINNFIKL